MPDELGVIVQETLITGACFSIMGFKLWGEIKSSQWVETMGTIKTARPYTYVVNTRTSTDIYHCLSVSYEYIVNGKRVTSKRINPNGDFRSVSKDEFEEMKRLFSKGNKVKVYYISGSPEKALLIKDDVEINKLIVFNTSCGVLFGGLGLFIALLRRKELVKLFTTLAEKEGIAIERIRTIVTFYGAGFNTTKTLEHYINPNNFGDDLAKYIAEQIEKRGAVISKGREFPGQDDFGWYVDFTYANKQYCLIVGGRPGEEGNVEWVAWLERNCGFIAGILGGRNKKIGTEAYELLHNALSGSDRITKMRWHFKEDFDLGNEITAGKSP